MCFVLIVLIVYVYVICENYVLMVNNNDILSLDK